MLERLRLADFKSFVDETVELSPLTLLVGANASGKSNFLDALRFLRETTTDLTFAELLDGEKGGHVRRWEGIRGGRREAARVGASVFAIESTWLTSPGDEGSADESSNGDDGEVVRVTHRLAIRTAPEALLEAESLGRERGEGSLFRTGRVTDDSIEVPWPAVPWRRGEKGESPTLVSREMSVLWEILGSINPGSPDVPADVGLYAEALSSALQRIRFLDIRPEVTRAFGRRHLELGDDGGNLSGVLAALCGDVEQKQTLVEWLAELCAPELVELDFVDVPELGDVMAILVEKGGKRISARSLSDGTLRFLGLLVALRTAPTGSLILMEEIESFLHPTRIRLLVEYLQAVVRERNVQVIATTHSPVVLQWLDKPTLRQTVIFGRTSEHEGTIMRRAGDLPSFDAVVERKGIAELFTTGWLENAL